LHIALAPALQFLCHALWGHDTTQGLFKANGILYSLAGFAICGSSRIHTWLAGCQQKLMHSGHARACSGLRH
jgi:hypothetical protein